MSDPTLHIFSESLGTCLCGGEWFEDQCVDRDTFAGACWGAQRAAEGDRRGHMPTVAIPVEPLARPAWPVAAKEITAPAKTQPRYVQIPSD